MFRSKRVDQPAVLLFDLGGVLVQNSMFDELPGLMPGGRSDDDLHDLWLSSLPVQRFERGEIDAERFADQFIGEWGLNISGVEFLDRVARWVKGFYPGASDLLRSLRKSYGISFLSNSNSLHWALLGDVLSHADCVFASHICGLVKPDRKFFQLAIEQINRHPGEICFFDDSARNVTAAREVGLRAYQTIGFDELARTISELGLHRFAND